MSIALPKGLYWDTELKLGPETAALTARVWPNYLVAESDLPEPGLKFAIHPRELALRFPVWGIRRETTEELVAFANGAQVAVDFSRATLPETGWQFAIESAASACEPNSLCLLVANVDPAARGLGLSRVLIQRAKLAARDLGFVSMIAPVRPTLKHQSPFTPMTQYILKRTENDEIYDPWINIHRRSGGQMVNICSESVRVRATLKKWREWTGLPLLTSGDCPLPEGLVPLKVDTHRNVGTYCEPNVWFRYSLGRVLAKV